MFKKTIALIMGCQMLVSPALGLAATIPGFPGAVPLPALAINTLPVARGNSWQGVQSISQTPGTNQLVINQDQPQALIDWSSFNIGQGASVRFNQGTGTPGTASWKPDSSFAALNRIYDKNPSLIYGNLSADGKVYLINQNGILFGPNSQVNVNSLIASTMNLRDKDFLGGVLNFTAENYQSPGYLPLTVNLYNQSGDHAEYNAALATNLSLSRPDSGSVVANFGALSAATGGSVFLLGPQVENSGTIVAPSGRIDLIAALQGEGGASPTIPDIQISGGLKAAGSGNDVTYWVGTAPGESLNREGGQLSAPSGQVNMYGANVWQYGVIRAISAVKQNGQIYLAARDKVTTGPNSLTDVSPDTSSEKVSQTFSFSGGVVRLLGLQTVADGQASSLQPLGYIEHYGTIEAPGGKVELDAVHRVYLETGSRIDVAGVWVDEPASADLLNAQLNSVQLADANSQKDGLTQGQNITTTLQNSASFGDVSGSFLIGEQTTREKSTLGGTISIGSLPAPNSSSQFVLDEFIAKQGAVLDFSGGGFRYAAGNAATTKLLNGTTVWDVSKAPQALDYQAILGSQQVVHGKFGVTENFQGLYLGGGTALNDYVPGRSVGSNAGTLTIGARQVALDGSLNGSVTGSQFQANVTPHTSDDHRDYDISVARGLEAPVGGTLQIGNDPGTKTNPTAADLNADSVVGEIVVKPSVAPLSASFNASTPLAGLRSDPVSAAPVTELSAEVLNQAGLSKLSLFSNGSLAIEAGVRISLLAGGSYTDKSGARVFTSLFTAAGRRIEDYGEVVVPGGGASFTLKDNVTSYATDPLTLEANSRYLPLTSTLYFAPGSVVSARGAGIDQSNAGSGALEAVITGSTGGGQITIQDLTLAGALTGNNLTVAQGALLDVSGGYLIDQSGKVNGADAGSLTLKAMNLSLAGDLRGFALPGQKGGALNLQTGAIVVGTTGAYLPSNLPPDATPPDYLNARLLLKDDRFADSGFTRIGLSAINDVTFGAGAVLAPSTARLALPLPAGASQPNNSVIPPGESLNNPDYLGATSVTVSAGANIYNGELPGTGGSNNLANPAARIVVEAGAAISSAPGGAITLKAPAVDLEGALLSPGGSVKITATGANLGATDVTLGSGALIQAAGYNKPNVATLAGQAVGPAPQAGGSVTLASNLGSVVLGSGSTVDVSGSAPVEVLTADAKGLPGAVTAAGAAGTLAILFDNAFVLDGAINGVARYAGVQGGTLSLTKTAHDPQNTGSFALRAADLSAYQAAGFDALAFKSATSLTMQGAMDVTAGRSLTLDAPLITAAGSDDVTLRAPWIRLVNTSGLAPLRPVAGEGAATLALVGDWVDLEGGLSVARFSDVLLSARRDLTLADRYDTAWTGSLETAGNLTLQGARVYPTTASSFSITSHGKATILPSEVSDTSPVYSAGGSLTVTADQGIEQRGVLAAPMGSINLVATGSGQAGRVYLAEGSTTTVSGAAPVSYGSSDGTFWTVKDTNGAGTGQTVTGAPDKSITLTGAQVIVKDGAQLDLAGGGSVTTSQYQTGIEGTANPFTLVGISQLTNQKIRPDRYVIMQDNSVQIPGYTYSYTDTDGTLKTRLNGAVYLAGVRLADGSYLKAGTYSLLPEQFAFLPGALILSDLGTSAAAGASQVTTDKYQVVAGYSTFLGTGIQSALLHGYSVRTASDVRQEGNFTTKEFVAGDAGSLTVAGQTTVMAGSFNAGSLPGYRPGSLALSGAAIEVQQTLTSLASIDSFDTPIPAAMLNKLQLAAPALSGRVGSLQLGDQGTSEIAIGQGSLLNIPNITLSANDRVTVESGAQLNAISASGGTVTLSVPKGKVTVQADALIHASDAITLDVNDVDLQGGLISDHSILNLAANKIVFVPDSYLKGPGDIGLYLTDKLWRSFASYENIGLTSRSDLVFQRDLTMTVGDTLTLDAGRFLGPADVALNAGNLIVLKNSGGAAALSSSSASGTLTLKAGEIVVSQTGSSAGDVVFDAFRTVNLISSGDLTLKGTGSLKASGDLDLTAARLTTSYYKDATVPLVSADFLIDASFGAGAINLSRGDGTPGTSATPGGSLAMKAGTITLDKSAVIEVPSGQVTLTASTGDITLAAGSQILAKGSRVASADPGSYSYFAGGRISLSSDPGKVNLQAGSTLDVSALYAGDPGAAPLSWDAGSIVLSSPKQGAALAGALNGTAANGQGGSFSLDSRTLDAAGGLDGLAAKLLGGGFNNIVSLRSRSGDLALSDVRGAAGQQLVALQGREVELVADQGALSISGRIDSDAAAGGRVALYAGTALTLEESAVISARGTAAGSTGGTVVLSSMDGSDGGKVFGGNYALQVKKGALIDVSGTAKDSSGTAQGGSVAFRAYQGKNLAADSGRDDVNMAGLSDGAVVGAARVSVEAARSYLVPQTGAGNANIGAATAYLADAAAFMAAASGLRNRLFSAKAGSDPTYHLQAGIELESAPQVDLTLNTNWDLSPATSNSRPGGEPGVVTLRAGGNLNLNANLVDHPGSFATLHSDTMKPTWSINLAAGSDPGGADPLAVRKGTGNLVVADGKLVYSEDAPINFASGGDTTLGYGYYLNSQGPGYMLNRTMRYNIGSYGGKVRGETGGDLSITGGAIQTTIGDIDLRIGGDLNLVSGKDGGSNPASYSIGSIRTTGEYLPGPVYYLPGDLAAASRLTKATDYWTYQGGGSISLDVAGKVAGKVNRNFDNSNGQSNAWDLTYYGTNNGSKGNETDVLSYLSADYEGTDATEGIATMAGGNLYLRAGGAVTSQLGVFGAGNLEVFSGGDLNGRFRLGAGAGRLLALGNFGTADDRPVLEIGSSRVGSSELSVVAMGELITGGVLNPFNTRTGAVDQLTWNLTYSPETSVSLVSLHGSATLSSTPFDALTNKYYEGYDDGNLTERQRVLPPVLSIIAAEDLVLRDNFALTPSATGNLRLVAGNDITAGNSNSGLSGSYSMAMIDLPTGSIYGWQVFGDPKESPNNRLFTPLLNNQTVLHQGDPTKVEVSAGRDIADINLYLDKPADISAQRDIVQLTYNGQNLVPEDLTSIRAGRDISYSVVANPLQDLGMQQGGPGTLLVQAGRNIDLGNAPTGIQTVGNNFTSPLGDKGSDLIVIAGAKRELLASEARAFFLNSAAFNQSGSDYSSLLVQASDLMDPKNHASAEQINDVARKILGESSQIVDQAKSGAVGIKMLGNAYSALQNLAKRTEINADDRKKLNDYAQQFIVQARSGVIKPLFESATTDGSGSITMVNSQIGTLGRSSDIYLLARGDLNVGKSVITYKPPVSGTGIYTNGGGSINVYGGRDVNVNESRVMTLLGGDITAWSDQGDVNAGRGSKTAVSPPQYQDVFDASGNLIGSKIIPPAIGSGIRAVTYDPNKAPGGALTIPEPGNIYLFAPQGVIDAGEAGIAGGRIVLGATAVLNAGNISASAGSVGVPASSEGSVSLGALSGAGSVSENSKMIEQASTLGGAREKGATQSAAVDDFMSKWLDLRIISFENDPDASLPSGQDEPDLKKRKKK